MANHDARLPFDRPSSGAARHLLPQAGEGKHRLIALGVFGAPQGVRGELRLKSYTRDPEAIGAYGTLTDARGLREFVLEALRPLKNEMLVARVSGVATR